MAELEGRQFAWQPPPMQSVEDTGLNLGFLSDMALKLIYFRGQVTGFEVAEYLKLPFQAVINPVLEYLKREQLCEVKGTGGGLGTGAYQYVITSKGITRAREQLERTTYLGAAPVPYEEYVKAMKAQGGRRLRVDPKAIRQALSHLVLDEQIVAKIGPAVNSGRSMFLYGPPGNGKTTIAEAIGRLMLGGELFIPYAVEADGQIIKVYDEINHVPVVEPGGNSAPTSVTAHRMDARWLRIKRPVIMVGGELTMEGLGLTYDYVNKYYEAPYQMKANGGMFLIDDFGRQQVRPTDLLNRWIVPMEKNVDFLSLHTGRKLEVPFNVLLVFSTNLPPSELVDEAFLRRIRHKVEIASPSPEEFREIFRRVCEQRKIPFEEGAVRYLLLEHYQKKNRPLRATHPRDLIDQLMDIASYQGIEPKLTKELLDRAAGSYFVET
ncbi:MAG: ATP-binding protein [Chloroflexota bacterium]